MRLFFAFVSLILVGCGNPPTFPLTATEDGCGLGGSDWLFYYLKVSVNVNATIKHSISSIRYEKGSSNPVISVSRIGNQNIEDYNSYTSFLNRGGVMVFSLVSRSRCGSLTPPPNDTEIYDILFIRIIENDQTHDYIAVGGSREDYEANMLTNDKYLAVLPAGAEILGYNFLYVPGTVLRSNLGLEPPSDTHGIYSDVDSSRRTREYRNPTLTLTINGTSGNDLVWSITESE